MKLLENNLLKTTSSKGQIQLLLKQAQERTGLDETGLAIAWLTAIPGSPIPVLGSVRDSRIESALKGCQTELPRPLWFALLEAIRGHEVA